MNCTKKFSELSKNLCNAGNIPSVGFHGQQQNYCSFRDILSTGHTKLCRVFSGTAEIVRPYGSVTQLPAESFAICLASPCKGSIEETAKEFELWT